jgi:hypothetical protein
MKKQKLNDKEATEVAVNVAIKFLTLEQLRLVLEFIALLPGEGKGEIHPKNGDQTKDS